MRLEHRGYPIMTHHHIHFNSIKVRLERVLKLNREDETAFQFHKGAIRTPLTLLLIPLFRGFQFHKGAIRTLLRDIWTMII